MDGNQDIGIGARERRAAGGRSTAIALRAVSVRRGGRAVVSDVTCDVPAGNVVGLIGPSGCGKTTLMRSIVGVQANVSGSIDVLGRPAGHPSGRSAVGYVTQEASVYGDLSVNDNVIYFARLLGLGDAAAHHVLASVQLQAMGRQRVEDLSGGERARVSLAIALLNQPPILVLDEPTVGLDPVLRRDLWAEFKTLAAAGTTLLISSHVMDEAERCDEIIMMRAGRILASGSPVQLLARVQADTVEGAFLALIDESESM